jgi:Na+-translocating ferredoxin:NAD+ oxidoreductase RnfE subunit
MRCTLGTSSILLIILRPGAFVVLTFLLLSVSPMLDTHPAPQLREALLRRRGVFV